VLTFNGLLFLFFSFFHSVSPVPDATSTLCLGNIPCLGAAEQEGLRLGFNRTKIHFFPLPSKRFSFFVAPTASIYQKTESPFVNLALMPMQKKGCADLSTHPDPYHYPNYRL
jgi:hypothetical protein